ncbi:coenzyme Q4 [Dermatophagoides farinae]|uniref:Ubiquinone biosynthesis protein COQ4 homolog, mitochondrial n=1 Tax=Dermatophagoides farinae TaxID=6954 RepID=A0A9D4SGP3_DERFA|nr:ubiquinone biosynthesis protein COQ4 homolog, mitochondrial-like [Dermatophagoides farinae]KAH7640405.1 ubiquinone biosynthesis protein coq4 [Dermatophagoides farinae]
MLRPNIVRQLTRIGFLNTINKQMICGSKRLYQDNHQQTYDESEFSHKNDDDNIEQLPMYDGHILLSPIQRTLLSVGSALAALNDPYRDDAVATFGETTGHYALRQMYTEMLKHPEGQRIIRDQPRIHSTTIDLEALGQLPPNTFGYNYYDFLRINKITPDSRKQVRFVDDPELAYVCQRYREVHDLVHCILSMPTNMLGEVLVKWVEAIQTGLPLCWFGGLFGAVKLNAKARQVYLNQGLPWALQCGHQAKKFMCIYYEERFEQDFEDLRKELNIPKPPKIGKIRSHV